MFRLQENYKDMLQTLTVDMVKVYPWAVLILDKMRKNRFANYPVPYYAKHYATVKRSGDKWHLLCFARNKNEYHNAGHLIYLPYGKGLDKGVVLFKRVGVELGIDSEYAYILFLPHAVERYRQRQLVENNINVPKDEQIEIMMRHIFPGEFIFDGGLVIMATEEGAFMGQILWNGFWQINTFIAYKDAYKNQREVLQAVRSHIDGMKKDIEDGKLKPFTHLGSEGAKEKVRKFIRKSGKYYEQAHKKQEVYEQQEVTREKVIDLSNL